ncbi:hypothetical protein Hanom_Chr13g01195001 [Helianthus anomalus]
MTHWTGVKKWIAPSAREPNISKAKGTKTCWFSAQALVCLSTCFDSAFLAACPVTNPFSLKPTKGETPVRSTQACPPSLAKDKQIHWSQSRSPFYRVREERPLS